MRSKTCQNRVVCQSSNSSSHMWGVRWPDEIQRETSNLQTYIVKYHLSYLSYVYIYIIILRSHYISLSHHYILLRIRGDLARKVLPNKPEQTGPERLNVAAARWWSHCLAQRMRTVLRSCGPAQPIRSAALGVSCRSESIWKLIFRFEPMPWAANDIQVLLIITTCHITPSKLSQQQWKTSSRYRGIIEYIISWISVDISQLSPLTGCFLFGEQF